jgi:hypothetical protein
MSAVGDAGHYADSGMVTQEAALRQPWAIVRLA